jgi:hypothetical protein
MLAGTHFDMQPKPPTNISKLFAPLPQEIINIGKEIRNSEVYTPRGPGTCLYPPESVYPSTQLKPQ